MIFNPPLFNFHSYNRYNRNYYHPSNMYNYNSAISSNLSQIKYNDVKSASQNVSKNFSKDVSKSISTIISNEESHSDNNALFEIFGIKLYYDDILLICLLFFLYNEGVQDQYLFISLILLLLS